MHKLFINISLAALAALAAWLIWLIVVAIADMSMFEAFPPIWATTWGQVAMVDLYLGLLVGAVLVIVLEQGKITGWLVSLAILALGNPILVLYLIWRRQKLIKLFTS